MVKQDIIFTFAPYLLQNGLAASENVTRPKSFGE
jgi:hypothetical protein